MSDFTYTAKPTPDEFILDLDADVDAGVDDAGAAAEQNETAAPAYTCGVCKHAMPVVLFMNCNHLSMCTPCYDRFIASVLQEHRLDNEDEDDDFELPPITFKCIACRTPHTREQVKRIFPL